MVDECGALNLDSDLGKSRLSWDFILHTLIHTLRFSILPLYMVVALGINAMGPALDIEHRKCPVSKAGPMIF
jgi:hypothetical protein